jgi:hypothetical protein
MVQAPPHHDQPITAWLRLLEQGQPEAAQPLWEHFCNRLICLASKKLSDKLRRSYDEEDAALSAFHSMCRVISDGRQVDLANRDNLWRLLVIITERKIMGRFKHELRGKRDARRTLSEELFAERFPESSGLNSLPGREPTPEFAVEFADMCGMLLDALGDDNLCQIVQLRLTNHDNCEIARRLGMTRRTVERKLLVIRARWDRISRQTGAT